jgi:hypothetical protein
MALHEVQLKGYSVRPGNLSLGTFDSYGIEQLHVTLDDTWSGLAIDATFHNTPSDKGVTMLVDADGLVPVPPEACKQPSKYATITFRGVQDGVQRISCNLPYMVLDHGQVPGANSTATPSENAQALAQMQDLRNGAVDAKRHAEAARDDAARSAVAAKEYETNAGQSATAAKTAQSAAETAKAGAETAQKAAASSASSASTSASTATTQAAAAKSSAMAAKASETTAGKSAQGAAASESAAKAAQTAAETAKANADTAASNAAAKATAAAKSAVAAKESEASAGQSATAAANSATAASGSATAAAGDAKTASDAAAGAADAKAAAVAAQKDAAASKAAAANSSAAAKTSEDAAAKSAADADSTANSIKESMTQIAALQKRQNVLVGSETGNPIAVDDAFSAPLCGLTVYGKSTQDGTPTPDAPVPIVSAGDSGSVVVKVTGKNLLYLPDGSKLSRGITVTAKDGLISISGTATSSGYANLDIKPFIASGVVILSSNIASPKVKLVTNTWGIALAQNTAGKMSDVATRIVFIVTEGQTYNLTGVKVQLELGTTATTYSPYREQLLTLPTPNGLPGIPVTSGGNYTDPQGKQWVCDEVDLERGVKVQRVNAVDLSTCVITGTTNLVATKRLAIRLPLKGKDYTAKALCNRLPYLVSFTSDTIHFYVDTNNAQVFIPIGAKNPEEGEYILFYVLDAPIETPLTPAEIAAYKAITAYAPDTVVQASDDAGVKLEYQRDVNLVVKNLEDAIASMTTT